MSKTMMEVTPEVLDDLIKWFSTATLPKELQLDSAVYIPDLKETVNRLIDQAKLCVDNPKMHGCIYLLIRIKHMLEGNPDPE